MEDLPSDPYGAEYGTLENGLTYYVRSNSKPKSKAALKLAVKVGSIVEEEEERGVAHMLEHLAFRTTTRHKDVTGFLGSIGLQFGPCQDGYTTYDETVYELSIPIDNPEVLSQAISVLAEFSSEIQVSAEGLDKERHIVLKEYNDNRNANDRLVNAYHQTLLENSKYADRDSIGLETVIRTVTPDAVMRFYRKWYNLKNMAVIVVGDFAETKSVVDIIKTHFEGKVSRTEYTKIPKYVVPSHVEPRLIQIVEPEATKTQVIISCKLQATQHRTKTELRNQVVENMFFMAMTRRLNKISRKEDPPYLGCSIYALQIVQPTKTVNVASHCNEKGTLAALESMLLEIARVRLRGFSDKETSRVGTRMMSIFDQISENREERKSEAWSEDYLGHFISNKAVMGGEYVRGLYRSIFPNINASELSSFSENFRTSSSCVIRIIEPRATATVDMAKAVVSKINARERDGGISDWEEEDIPEEILTSKPNPGSVVSETEHPLNIGATEIMLSNGMKVCFKRTDLRQNDVYVKGFAFGGLSELAEGDYISCETSSGLATQIGAFGHRQSVMVEMLADRDMPWPHLYIGEYTRSFGANCPATTAGLETALQLVYQLFTTHLAPSDEELKKMMNRLRAAVEGRGRVPYTALADRMRELMQTRKEPSVSDLERVDLSKACQYFNQCFKDPSTFSVVIVGNIDLESARNLIVKYLGGIPRPAEPTLNYNRAELKDRPYAFPTTAIREVVHVPMVEQLCQVDLSIPLELKGAEDLQFRRLVRGLLESKIYHGLRFEQGLLYSVDVRVHVADDKPGQAGSVHGYVSVRFSCDPASAQDTVDAALEAILHLQHEGPSDADINSVLAALEPSPEHDLEDNEWWANQIVNYYQSGEVDSSEEVTITAETARLSLQTILPYPCKNRYTAVILSPKASP